MGHRADDRPVFTESPDDFTLADVVVRLVRPHERVKRDATVEANHHVRDRTFDEDACLARTGFAPENNALCTNIAIALIIHKTTFDNFASATRHFALKREDAFDAILSP